MGRKPRASESPPLPPFEYMSRNRRAVFGDPPSAYLAAVIERNERARKKREQDRLENEQNQDEELPRKRHAPDNNNQANAYLTPAENDYLVLSGSGIPSNRYGHLQFTVLKWNEDFPERIDNPSTDQATDKGEGIEGYGDKDVEQSQDSEYDGSKRAEENDGNGNTGFHDSEDDDNDADMADDENISTQRQSQRSSQTTVTEKDEGDVDNGHDCRPGDRNNILLNKDLCAPFPIKVDGDSAIANLLSFASNNTLSTHNRHIRRQPAHQPHFAISNRSSSHMFSVPGAIFVDPIDFDDDDIRSLAHNLAANFASQSLDVHRYSPISQAQGVFLASGTRTALLPTVSASISDIDRDSSNQDDPFREGNDNGAAHFPDELSYELGYQGLG